MSTVNFQDLEKYHAEGLLKKQKHSKYDLHIWNYSEKTQYERKWDHITSICRGLITDSTGKIIGRSFNKFHNYEEQEIKSANKSASDVRIFNKSDGSLGILFNYNNEWLFSSRGSFESPQAIKGYSMIPEKFFDVIDPNVSYIFEIIYPENRIVVDYKDKECLVFLAAFKTDGTEIHYHEKDLSDAKAFIPIFEFMQKNGIETVEELTHEFPEHVVFDDLKSLDLPNKEGYVILLNDLRIKIKFETYRKLQKMRTNLTVKHVFEMIRAKKPLNEILEEIPDENYTWFHNLRTDINNELERIKKEITDMFYSIFSPEMSRPSFASAVNKIEIKYKRYMFKMFDNKKIFDNDLSMLYDLIDISELEKRN